MKKILILLVFMFLLTGSLFAQNNQWTWLKGDNTTSTNGQAVYGALGVSSTSNKPGARESSVTWTDASGNIWMFGGYGVGATGTIGFLADLWKYDPLTNQWVWIKGSSSINATGQYGTQAVSSSSNVPGGRSKAVSWVDPDGKFWMFGGYGYAITNSADILNDLWKYDPATNQWTWIKGSSDVGSGPVYGTLGNASNANTPGARLRPVSWTDDNGNLWLFGGTGYDRDFSYGELSDLWKFNRTTSQWAWMKGNDTYGATGIYGTQGVASSNNYPGGRQGAVSWKDTQNNLWLFGGNGQDSSLGTGTLDQVWKYSIATGNWTWVKGSSSSYPAPVYGSVGASGPLKTPGGAENACAWSDAAGNGWILNTGDLWKFNITTGNWSLIKFAPFPSTGIYGTQGVSSPSNNPPTRTFASACATNQNTFWLFGGGYYFTSYHYFNDLWRFEPCLEELSLTAASNSFCFGVDSIKLTVTGGSGSFEWFKDGTLISGQQGDTLYARSGGSYYARLASGNCTKYSNEILLQQATVQPGLGGTGIYCDGDNVNVGIPITEVDQYYTWLRNGSPVYGPIGGNGSNQSLNFSMDASRVGMYEVVSGRNGCNTVLSNQVYVNYAFVSTTYLDNLCDDHASFSWEDVAPNLNQVLYEYAVTEQPFPPASGTQTNKDTVTVFSLQPSTTYYFHIRAACGFGFSNFGEWNSFLSFTTPANHLSSSISPQTATICSGSTQVLTVSGGTQNYWYLNGVQLPFNFPTTSYPATEPGVYTVLLTEGDCRVQASNSAVITVIQPPAAGTSIWTGSVSTNWNNPLNWKCGVVPGITSTVIINAGAPNYPAVTSNLTVKSLVINSDASFFVNPGVVVTVTN